MKKISKKSIAMLAVVALVALGVMVPVLAQKAPDQPPMDPDKMAQRIADMSGLDKDAVLKYLNNGTNPRDLGQAAFMAKASGKSLDEVLTTKQSVKSWKEVAEKLGVTKEQMKATRDSMVADHLNKQIGADRQSTLNLLGQGYHAPDIAMGTLLAQNSGKSIDEVLSLKKINNTWRDVAASLGVDDNTLKQDLQKLRPAHGPNGAPDHEGFPGGPHHKDFKGPNQ